MPDANTPDVSTSITGGVMVIVIDRPHAKNAMTLAAARGIAAAVDELESRDDLNAAIITGANNTFCAGMDLKGFVSGELPTMPGRGFGGLTEAPPSKPLIAAVEGWALAGGFEMALACDLIVAAHGARFGLPEVKRGLVAAAGGLLRLPERVPVNIAMELALTGEPMTAQRAADLGLVNRVVDDGEALATALDLAATIASNGPLAVRTSKQILTRHRDWSATDRWSEQQHLVDPVFASADATEGARAFAEKRQPSWTGR